MLCLISKQDMTSYVPYESINIEQMAGDPQGKATFQVIDPGSTFALTAGLQEVIFIDETATLGATTLTPGHNYIKNNNFNFGSGNWSLAGTLSSSITFPSSGTFGSGAKATISISNVAGSTNGQAFQNVGAPYVITGQSYCLSGTLNITTPFTNADVWLQFLCVNASNGIIAQYKQTYSAATGGTTRVSVSGAAPTGTVTLQISIGVETTSATNSGTATWTAMQIEPVWFPSLYSYPTPICDFLQANCVTLPDGTTSRFDRIFCGNITHTTASYEGTTRIWDIEATSLEGILENATLVNATYNGVTDQSIITGIANNLPFNLLFASTPSLATGTPQALAYANVPICYSGVTVNDLQFADATFREVLNTLADITGFLFGVDSYYNVFYYPPMYVAAPYSFVGNGTQPDNVSTFAYYDYSKEDDATQIQSAINVSGSTYSLTITESWHIGDGSHVEGSSGGLTNTFVPFHNPNQIAMTLVGGSTTYSCVPNPGTGGAPSSGTAWVDENFPSLIINPALSAGTAISLTYSYDALVYVQARAPASIGQYGRPMYSKINDTNLVNNTQATTEGEAQLQAYAQPRTTLKFKTLKYLAPGWTIEFTSTLDGITKAHYVVQKVTASYLSNGLNQYDVECGVYVDSFVDFFRNSQKAINRADHDPTEPIKQYNNLLLDSTSFTDSLSIHP